MVEILTGLRVTDEELYSQYRAHMMPLLHARGGSFGVDLRVGEILKNPSQEPFNRLFTIRFPSLLALDAFFADPEYLAIRRRYFEPSVAYVTRLGRYELLP